MRFPKPRDLRPRMLAGELVKWLRKPGTQQAIGLLMATQGVKWVLEDFQRRLLDLEAAAELREDLRALEDVATLADLERLRADVLHDVEGYAGVIAEHLQVRHTEAPPPA